MNLGIPRLKLLLIGVLVFFNLKGSRAQGPTSHWHFGNQAGIVFDNYQPTSISNSSLSAIAGCSSISTSEGQLLYYGGPSSIFNQSGLTLSNSDSLKGHNLSHQGALFVPNMIDKARHFYVTNKYDPNLPLSASQEFNEGFFIHEILANLESPMGRILPNKKNQLFSPKTGTRLTALHHANGRDVWLVIRRPYSDTLLSYLVDENGINQDPVVSLSSVSDTTKPFGQLKASPNGEFLAESFAAYMPNGENFGMVHQFDRTTGKASNSIILPAFTSSATGVTHGGVEFSQSGKYVYYGSPSGLDHLIQYDLSIYDSTSVVSSQYQHAFPFGAYALQIGIDRKIYISSPNDTILRRVENPDTYGSALVLNNSVLNLAPGISFTGLPDFIQTYFHPAYFDYSRMCGHEPVKFWVRNNNIDSVRWDFGDPASGAQNTSTLFEPQHQFTSNDTFGVTCITYSAGEPDTFYRELIMFSPPDLSAVDSLYKGCTGEAIELDIPLENKYTNVFWSDSLDTNFRVFTQPDSLLLTVYNFCDTITQPMVISFENRPQVNLGNDTLFCSEMEATVSASHNGFGDLLWSTSDTTNQITVTDSGSYWVEASNGCDTVRDSISVSFLPAPAGVGFSQLDTCLTLNEAMPLPKPQNGINQIVRSGLGEILVDYFEVGSDTVTIERFNACDTVKETVVVNTILQPEGELLLSGDLCASDSVEITYSAYNEYQSLLWSTGERTEQISVTDEGVFSVEVVSPPCTNNYSMDVISEPCKEACQIELPNIFSPNNDGVNDRFEFFDYDNCMVVTKEFSVFNRWGSLVFYHSGEHVSWDGFVNGLPATDGAYYYLVKAEVNGKEVLLKGSVQLLR